MAKKILIIEDNDKNMMLFRDILTYHGYAVIEAKDGESGIRSAKENHPDLILMDIQLPVIDGFTAVRILKNDPVTKNIKIVGITSYAMSGDREKIMAAGFDGYISKPMDTREFPKTIARYLETGTNDD
jgi:CheY-like chemotaxis protein